MKNKKLNLSKALEQGAALPPGGDGQLLLAAGLVKFEHLPTWQGARGLERTFEALAPAISARTALVALERGRVVACQLGSTRMRGMVLQAVAASYMAGEAFLLHALQAHLDVAAAVSGPVFFSTNTPTPEPVSTWFDEFKKLATSELRRLDPELLRKASDDAGHIDVGNVFESEGFKALQAAQEAAVHVIFEAANAYTLEDYERMVAALKAKDHHFTTVINADSLSAFELLRNDPDRLKVVEALKERGGLPLAPEELAEGGKARLAALQSLGFVIDGNEEALLERFDSMYPGEWIKFLHHCLDLREPRDKTCIGHVLANLPSCP